MILPTDYQVQALRDLEDFMRRLESGKSIAQTFAEFWSARDVTAERYRNNLRGVPQICFKVPTGGGKTFMAASSLRVIFDGLPSTQSRFVVWLVPSETILTQTCKNLSDTAHDYRRRLESDFNGRVAVYTKEQLLMGENFSPAQVAEQLTVAVLSYDSFRTSNRDGRRAYRQNGQLYQFSALTADDELLPDADEMSLVSVIRHYKPVVIVDESHRATTPLSIDMLKNFNPSFILELTATPRDTSNVIVYVPAAKLKSAAMVKLPVIVYNRRTKDDVISDAIHFRESLERVGRGEGIRPIVLFQAESKGNDADRATYERIKADLLERGIPAAQIAIKTADINELKNVDLMAIDCPIRYIITINALKEGWDCPFAYVLASLANRTSEIDVEQILGRILRRPFKKNFSDALLNQSYVLTSSADFQQTLQKIVVGLNAAGFSRRDYRAQDLTESVEPAVELVEKNIFDTPKISDDTVPSSDDMPPSSSVAEMIKQAQQFAGDYPVDDMRWQEEKAMMTEFHMREEFIDDARSLQLPKFFYVENSGSLFGGESTHPVSMEWLSKNFSLADKDIVINFDNPEYGVASVDIRGNEDAPNFKQLSDADRRYFLEHFAGLMPAAQVNACVDKLTAAVDKNKNAPPTNDIRAYVRRIVEKFDHERICDAMMNTGIYAKKIADKIDALLTVHAKKIFAAQVAARKIFAEPRYTLPATITPTKSHGWSNSLYESEEFMNRLEWKIAFKLTGLDGVRWWHRNRSRNGFCLNGFINHYPDFIVRMKSGRILLVESKGDDRDNSDSRRKLELGKLWESMAGVDKFGYFMVFDNNSLDGALNLDEFVAALKEL